MKVYFASLLTVTMLVAPVPLALPVLSHLEITTGVREGYLRVAI